MFDEDSEYNDETYDYANILSNYFFKRYNQCDIYINESKKNIIRNYYDFSNSENDIYFIRIIWNISIYSAFKMFEKCEKIIKIDLSKF